MISQGNKLQLITLATAILARRRTLVAGKDGRDAPTLDDLTGVIRSLIPAPIAGKDGRDAPTLDDLTGVIRSLIPAPIAGKDGKTPIDWELRGLIKPLIPEPIRGKDAPSIDEIVKKVLNKITLPEDGRPPRHEVKNKKIRFKQPNGDWGQWLDLGGQNVYITKTVESTHSSTWADNEQWVD